MSLLLLKLRENIREFQVDFENCSKRRFISVLSMWSADRCSRYDTHYSGGDPSFPIEEVAL
jgi:hypothetical protein